MKWKNNCFKQIFVKNVFQPQPCIMLVKDFFIDCINIRMCICKPYTYGIIKHGVTQPKLYGEAVK
jgi:hypothetical protein